MKKSAFVWRCVSASLVSGLSYMLGKLAFLAQRTRAQKVLGAKFDIRKFHDAMLLLGAVPLELLEHAHG